MLPPDEQKDFEDFEASQLFCSTCKRAKPVRKRLFLVLLDKEIFDYASAPGVALWWGKRNSRGGDRCNGRESEGQPEACLLIFVPNDNFDPCFAQVNRFDDCRRCPLCRFAFRHRCPPADNPHAYWIASQIAADRPLSGLLVVLATTLLNPGYTSRLQWRVRTTPGSSKR